MKSTPTEKTSDEKALVADSRKAGFTEKQISFLLSIFSKLLETHTVKEECMKCTCGKGSCIDCGRKEQPTTPEKKPSERITEIMQMNRDFAWKDAIIAYLDELHSKGKL